MKAAKGGMLSLAFDMPGEQDKPMVKTKPNKKGDVAAGKQAMPVDPTIYKPPTHGQRLKAAARDEKVHATRRWVAGEMSTKQHSQVHARANKVLKGKVGR